MLEPPLPPCGDRKQISSAPVSPGNAFDSDVPHSSHSHVAIRATTVAEPGSRTADGYSLEDSEDQEEPDNPQDIIMAEVIDCLEFSSRDEFWSAHAQRLCRTPTSNDDIVGKLATACYSTATAQHDPAAFDLVLYFVALQLLASCYTLLPASSAEQVPITQQRRGSRLITALRLHCYRRFSPAAGYHAREPSETSPWPGLYSGPSEEEKIAEIATRQRKMKAHSLRSLTEVRFPSPCYDGPADDHEHRHVSRVSEASSKSSDIGLISKWICQPAPVRHPPRKTHFLFLSHFRRKEKKQPHQQEKLKSPTVKPHLSPLQKLASHAVFKMPSALLLRHTQSAPRTPPNGGAQEPVLHDTRRNSSDPTIGSPICYTIDIPEIRRISASIAGDPGQGRIYALGKSDLLASPEYFPVSGSNPFDPAKRTPPGRLPFGRGSYFPSDGISPFDLGETPGGRSRRSDYFASPLPSTQEEKECSSEDSDRGRNIPLPKSVQEEADANPDYVSSSDDSVNNEGKRKPVVGMLADSAAEFSERLRTQETGFEDENDVVDIN